MYKTENEKEGSSGERIITDGFTPGQGTRGLLNDRTWTRLPPSPREPPAGFMPMEGVLLHAEVTPAVEVREKMDRALKCGEVWTQIGNEATITITLWQWCDRMTVDMGWVVVPTPAV